MVLTADQQRVKALLTETITLLCKNGLHFKSEFSIEGLIGITLDGSDIFLVSIKETVKAHFQGVRLHDQGQTHSVIMDDQSAPMRRNPRKRRKSEQISVMEGSKEVSKWQSVVSCAMLTCGANQMASVKQESATCEVQLNDNNQSPVNLLEATEEVGNSLIISSVHGNHMDWEEKLEEELDITLASNRTLNNQTQEVVSVAEPAKNTELETVCSNVHIRQNRGQSITLKPEEEAAFSAENEIIHIKEETASDEELSRSENSFASYLGLYGTDVIGQGYGSASISSNQLPQAPDAVPGCSRWNQKHSNRRPTSPQQQVELMPGTGVYISYTTHLQFEQDQTLKGSKLVRRLVHELFPDERVLATSSCLGKRQGTSHTGLDQQKVDAIKAFVQLRLPHMSHSKIVLAINECCRDARTKLRRLFCREWNSKNSSIHGVLTSQRDTSN